MKPDSEFEQNPGLLRDTLRFLAQNRKWWLTPIAVVIVLMGALLVLGGTSAAPFIYSLF